MNSNVDHNPFRENEQQPITPLTGTNLAPESPHVAFADRSPSIMPTPIYDDTSSVGSFPHQSPSIAALSPSPLSRQVESSPATPTPGFEDKTEIEENKNGIDNQLIYGPTFQEEDISQQYNASATPNTSSLLTKGFVPRQQEEIQMYETNHQYRNQQSSSSNIPPPEQSRVDIFMSKLKGYQQAPPANVEEEERTAERGFHHQGQSHFPGTANQQPFIPPLAAKQRGLMFRQLFGDAKYPIFTWISAVVMIGVFIYELVRNTQLSGSLIQTSPFNPMIGPNYMALVNMGSKFVPCMRETTQYPPSTLFGNCYQSLESTCTVEEVCGFGGFNGQPPNQAFRFFVPIFLHGGVVHILMNMITHLQLGGEVERNLGLLRYIVLYFVSGIWGFVLSAVLSGITSSSMGCSGALFGIVGFTVIDLIVHWKQVRRPGRELSKILFVIVIALVLGLFPGLDNFAHIGGLIMGLLLGLLLASKRPSASKRAVIITWIIRIVSFIVILLLYIVFIRLFYTASDLSTVCPRCKYLSCLPIKDWCDV